MNRLLLHVVVTLGIAGFLIFCPCAGAVLAGASGSDETVAAFTVGNARVWAIADSKKPMNMRVFPSADPLALSQYAPLGEVSSSIMVFVVHHKEEWILIDTGLGDAFSDPNSGMTAGLKAAGIASEQISRVLLTHMHGDHIGGLVQDGKRTFPNAGIFLSRPEFEFWKNPASVKQFPNSTPNFDLARKILALYGKAIHVFDYSATVAPGIQALDAHGHTPGHTAFLLTSNGEKLLFVGDIVHAAALQFPRPDIGPVYDMNPAVAAATRIRLMEQAAKENLVVAGAHLPFPSVGRVKVNDGGGYGFVPGF